MDFVREVFHLRNTISVHSKGTVMMKAKSNGNSGSFGVISTSVRAVAFRVVSLSVALALMWHVVKLFGTIQEIEPLFGRLTAMVFHVPLFAESEYSIVMFRVPVLPLVVHSILWIVSVCHFSPLIGDESVIVRFVGFTVVPVVSLNMGSIVELPVISSVMGLLLFFMPLISQWSNL